MGYIQSRLVQVGVGKQTVKGTPSAAAAYNIGVSSGQVAKVDVAEDDLPLTWSDRLIQGHDRKTATPGIDFETIVTPKAFGLLGLGALGTDAVTGAGPYTHTLTTANDLPYLTFFAKYDSKYYTLQDAKADTLELSFEQSGSLKAKVGATACGWAVSGTPYTITNSEMANAGTFDGATGIMQINGASAVIKQGSIKIANKVEPIFGADAVLPQDVAPGQHTCDVSLTVVAADWQLFLLALTGTTSGTTVATNPTYSTATLKWILDANTDLTFAVNRMKVAVGFPAAAPAGGPAELVIEGKVSEPASGSAYSLALKNNVATY